jgi:hypothetical protein
MPTPRPRTSSPSLAVHLFFIFLSFINHLPSPASAELSNSFCTGLANVAIDGSPPQPNINGYTLTSLCLSFYNATSYGLEMHGNVIYKNTYLPASDTTCIGDYLFAQDQRVTFSANLALPTCVAPTGAAFSFCWACAKFVGTYVPFFDSIDAPTLLTIAPGDSQPQPYLWGGLPDSLLLVCNTTSCGSASDVIPPSPLPLV